MTFIVQHLQEVVDVGRSTIERSIRRIFMVRCLSAALILRIIISLCWLSNHGVAYHDAISSARCYVDRCPEAAMHFTGVDGAISMHHLNRAVSDDVLQLAALYPVVVIDLVISAKTSSSAQGPIGSRLQTSCWAWRYPYDMAASRRRSWRRSGVGIRTRWPMTDARLATGRPGSSLDITNKSGVETGAGSSQPLTT